MLCFRDMTYCCADCGSTNCERHMDAEKADREKLPAISWMPTAWADFSETCGAWTDPKDAA